MVNTICFNVFNLPVNGYINTFWYGFYCSLKKQDYTMNNSLIIIAVGFMLLRLALFLCGFIKGKYQSAVQNAIAMLLALDLMGICLYFAFYLDVSGLFKLYFSFSSLFLVSGHVFGVPLYLPFVLVMGESILLYLSNHKLSFRQIISYLFIALGSVLFWYTARLLVLRLF